jgi:hypothetical protein
MATNTRRGFWFGFNTTAVILSVLFFALVPTAKAVLSYAQSVDILLSPTAHTGVYALILQNPNTTPLNALEFELHFDPKVTRIENIELTPTLCEERFVITHLIDNALGHALVECGTVTPFTHATGTVALIHVRGNVPRFGTTTHVLAHDGLGTDATRDILVLSPQ